MAKQSFKAMVAEQVVNSQLQKIYEQQRAEDLKTAQNILAQYQPTDDDMALAQSILAQYPKQPTQEAQPKAQPVQQATVNEVKAQNAPIPSLEKPKEVDLSEWFKPKTASGRDINKESAERKSRIKQDREDYQRQQQEENMLASGKKAQKTSKNDSALVGGNIKQMDLSQYDFSESEESKKINEDISKAEKWTQPDYKMSKDEEKEAKRIAQQGLERLSKVNDGSVASWGRRYKDMTPDEQREYDLYKQLETKTNDVSSMAIGAANAIYRAGKALGDIGLKTVSRQANANARAQNDIRNTFGMDPLMSKENLNEITQAPKDYENKVAQLDKRFNPVIQNAKTQSPVAAGVGGYAGNAAMYMATSPLVEGTSAAAGLGKLGTFVVNQVLQNVQDEALDTQALKYELEQQGYTPEEINSVLWKSRVINAGFNLGMGVIPEIPGLIKKANNTAPIPAVGDDIDELVQNATKQAEEAAQNIDNIAKQMPQSEITPKTNGPISPMAAYEDLSRNIIRVPDNIQEIAESNKPLIKEMDAVSIVDGEKFKGGEGSLKDKVFNFFASIGGKAHNDILGDVELTKTGIKGSIAHNKLTRRKVDTFASVPDVIEKGKIISYQPAWKGRDYDTAIIVAPTKVKNPDGTIDDFITGVIVKRDKNQQRFYAHDAVSINSKEPSMETGTPSTNRQSSQSDGSLSIYNILRQFADDKASAIDNAKNSVNTSGNIDVSGKRPRATDQGVSPSIENEAEAMAKAMDAENAAKTQRPELPEETQEKLLSDFEEIFNSMNKMAADVEASGNAKAIEKYEKLQRTVFDYEEKLWKSDNLEEINNAKKAADAARQSFIREMKKTDPNYKGTLTGTKLGQAQYRLGPQSIPEDQAQEIVDDWVKQDIENPNRFVRDAEPDTGIKEHLGGKVMAEDAGLTPEDSFKLEEEIPDKGAFVEDGKSRVVTNSAINSDVITKEELENDPIIQDIANYQKHRNDVSFAEASDRVTMNGKQWKDDYISGKKTISGDTDVDTSMILLQDLKNKMDTATDPAQAALYANERNALLRKLREYGTTSGQGIQAFAKWNNTADGALLNATKIQEDDVIKPWISRNQKAADGNSRIARALSDMGNKWKVGKNAPELTHDQIKEGVIAELNREVGSVEQHFNDNDIEFLTQLAEDKSIPVWKITSEIEHKLNTGKWYTLDESLPIPQPTNKKLQNALNSLVTEQIRTEKAAPTLKQITEEVKNTLGKESADYERLFSDEDINYLANLINNGASKQELADALNIKMATGNFGISQEVQQEVNNIFKQISQFDIDSKQFVEGQAEAYRLLANEVLPNATGLEKFEAWRYLAMLGNPKTMLRNFIGNQTFGAVTGISNNIAAAAEAGIDKGIKALGGEGIQRTKSVLNPISDSGLIKAAAEDADASRYRQIIGSKYEKMDKDALRRSKSVFNSKLAQFYEKVTDAGISDYQAVKNKFSTSLAGYLKANGYDTNIFKAETELQRLKNLSETQLLSDAEKGQIESLTKDVAELNKARDYALKQAEYATFHEDNAVANLLTKFSREARNSDNIAAKGLGTIVEGVVPFKKTPANVLRSGLEYSPLGAIKSIKKTGKLIYENTGKRAGQLADTYTKNTLRGGTKEVQKTLAADVIDSWAKTLTGTGLTALGFYLYDKGIIHSSNPDTKYQDELEGHQNYSIEINGKSYTIDWAAPTVMPLMVGAEIAKLWDSTGKGSEDFLNNIDSYVAAANRIADPLVETSMLSGVKDTLETAANAAQYNENINIPALVAYNAVTGYATQGVPTIAGQVARTIDPTRRSTYTDKEGVAGVLDKQLKKQMNKIPGLSMLNQPYVDTYGREQNNSPFNNAAGNLAYQMLSPGYLSNINETEADKISREAYEVGKTASTLPKWQSNFKNAEGQRVSPENYTTAARAYGQANYDIRQGLAKDEWFNSLDDPAKEEIVKNINTIAEHVGNAAIDPEYNKDSKAYQAYKEGGLPTLLDYYKDKEAGNMAKESGLGATSKAYKEIKEDIKNGNTKAAEAKISDAQKITDAGINTYGYKAYEANKSRIANTDSWISEYKKIDSLGNSDGFVNQDEFKAAAQKHKWTEEEAVKNAKLYGNWKKIPYLKKDGSWGFH